MSRPWWTTAAIGTAGADAAWAREMATSRHRFAARRKMGVVSASNGPCDVGEFAGCVADRSHVLGVQAVERLSRHGAVRMAGIRDLVALGRQAFDQSLEHGLGASVTRRRDRYPG
jgi:hypothetical protein